MHPKAAYLAIAAAMLTAVPLAAHHSFVMFDTTAQVTVTGSVTSFEWTNPHTYIELDAAGKDDVVKHWSIELGSPSILRNSGWKHDTLKPGDRVTLIINPLKSGMPGGLLLQATLSDGRKLGNGPGRGPK